MTLLSILNVLFLFSASSAEASPPKEVLSAEFCETLAGESCTLEEFSRHAFPSTYVQSWKKLDGKNNWLLISKGQDPVDGLEREIRIAFEIDSNNQASYSRYVEVVNGSLLKTTSESPRQAIVKMNALHRRFVEWRESQKEASAKKKDEAKEEVNPWCLYIFTDDTTLIDEGRNGLNLTPAKLMEKCGDKIGRDCIVSDEVRSSAGQLTSIRIKFVNDSDFASHILDPRYFGFTFAFHRAPVSFCKKIAEERHKRNYDRGQQKIEQEKAKAKNKYRAYE